MVEWLSYCICIRCNSVQTSPSDINQNSLYCYVLRVFAPHWLVPYLADMLAICRQHDEYLAAEFEPMSMLLLLDSPAALPVRTRVLICRVTRIYSNMLAA
jgi:hypothetical protein